MSNPEPHTTTPPVAFNQSGVKRMRESVLPEGVKLIQYRNANERVFYENPHQHTFSLYLHGGFETFRTDQPAPKGAPGRFCLMPQSAYSAWDVGCQQDFVHVYFDDGYLKRLAMKTFDLDPRRVSLPHLTFAEDRGLDAICRYSLMNWDWQMPENSLALEQATQNLLINLLKSLGIDKPEPASLTAGLSPAVRRLVVDYIQAHFSGRILLSELADIAGLSEYHFCRMFKISLAETPQSFVTRVRVEHVKTLLKGNARAGAADASERLSLADIALQCGFSNQSHMGRFFRKYTGMTPGQYAKSL